MGARAYPENIEVEVNSVALGIRPSFNLIAGAGIALAGADNPGADRVDVTIATTAGALRDIFIQATDYDSAAVNPYRSQAVAGTGVHDFTFYAPVDFLFANLVALELFYITQDAGAAGINKEIDFFSEYAFNAQAKNFNFVNHPDPAGPGAGSYTIVAQNVHGTFDLTNLAGTHMFPNLAAGHRCGLRVDHKGIGGSVNYLGIRLAYTV